MRSKGREMKSYTRMAFVAIAGIAIIAGSGMFTPAAAQGNIPASAVFQPGSVMFGRTYSEWSAEWWQWALSLPADGSPLFDTADCNTGQSGPVFFLGGKFCPTGGTCDFTNVKRRCTVPVGKAIHFPILNFEESLQEEQISGSGPNGTPLTQISELRQLVENEKLATGLSVTLDGKSLKDPSSFRVQSPAFAFTLPDNNLFQATYSQCQSNKSDRSHVVL